MSAKQAADEETLVPPPGTPKKRPGRPETRVIKLDATPERIARAMFAAVKPPDPNRRKRRAD